MSGWPSGLRRQTQGSALSLDKGFSGDFWSSDEGVGSNPTSDNNSFETCDTEYRNIWKSKYFNKFTDKISGSNPTKEKCSSNPSDFKARNATNSSPTTFVQSNIFFSTLMLGFLPVVGGKSVGELTYLASVAQ